MLGANAAQVRAELNRNVVPVGESVILSVIFEGDSPLAVPSLPSMAGLTVGGMSQRNEFSIVNGVSAARHVFEFTLLASQAGDIAIPAMQFQLRSQLASTQPLMLKVLPAAAAAPGPTNLAVLKLLVPKTEVYLGEAFPVEIHLYWQNAENGQTPQLKAEGFTLGQSAKPVTTGTIVAGVHYNLAIFRLSAAAAKPGNLNLGPAECSLTVLIPLPNQRPRGFFDLGPRMQQRPTTLQSDAQSIRVLPLPTENVPETFAGAVGSYTLAFSAGPTNLAVGDPLTVRAQIRGRGFLDAIRLAPQPQWRDFKAYDANSKIESEDPLGLSGAKTFEQVIIPQNHEIAQLPPMQFSFFDPDARTYRTLTGPAIPLTVRPSVSSMPPPLLTNAAPPGEPPPSDDIVHIRPRLDTLAVAQPSMLRRSGFLAAQAIPIVAWLGLVIFRKRRESLANNPRLRRQREVAPRIQQGLRELPVLAGTQKADDFFATVFRLLQEQLGERLDVPSSAITEAIIEEKLRGRGLADATLQELHELFQACNQARYAPHRSSQELSAYIPRVQSVLRTLQQWKA